MNHANPGVLGLRLIASATYAKLCGPRSASMARWRKRACPLRLCAAIFDRLAFACNIIGAGTVSSRLAHARGSPPRPANVGG